MKYAAMVFGLASAALWLFSAMKRLPAMSYEDFETFEAKLRYVGYLNASAAVCSAISVMFSAFSN